MYVPAGLSEDEIHDLQSFEAESGLRVLALAPLRVEPAAISADILARLQQLERELGVCLLAVK